MANYFVTRKDWSEQMTTSVLLIQTMGNDFRLEVGQVRAVQVNVLSAACMHVSRVVQTTTIHFSAREADNFPWRIQRQELQ